MHGWMGWPLDAGTVRSTRPPLEDVQRDVGQQWRGGCDRLMVAANPACARVPCISAFAWLHDGMAWPRSHKCPSLSFVCCDFWDFERLMATNHILSGEISFILSPFFVFSFFISLPFLRFSSCHFSL